MRHAFRARNALSGCLPPQVACLPCLASLAASCSTIPSIHAARLHCSAVVSIQPLTPRILVLDHGQVVEFGTPWELMQDERGSFRDLCRQSGEEAQLFEVSVPHRVEADGSSQRACTSASSGERASSRFSQSKSEVQANITTQPLIVALIHKSATVFYIQIHQCSASSIVTSTHIRSPMVRGHACSLAYHRLHR